MNRRLWSIGFFLVIVSILSGVTLTEVQDPSLGTNLAAPSNIAAAGNNTFFITSQRSIGAGGTGTIVGWFYDPGTSTLTQVQDPSLGTQKSRPGNIATENNAFFIVNSENIGAGGVGSIVGWYYNPGTSTLTQVLDPSLGTK